MWSLAMAFSLFEEQIVGLADAGRILPRIGGKRIHASTVWRWCRKGVRGIRLEHIRLGHRICTSVEALNRFAQRLAEAEDGGPDGSGSSTPSRPSTPDRRAAIERAEQGLSELGI
jgi:hypothetical protein